MPFYVIIGVLLLVCVLVWVLWRKKAPSTEPPQTDTPTKTLYFTERQQQLSAIAAQHGWSEAAYDHVLNGHIAPGMTQDMVLLAWGGPSQIDHKTVTAKHVPVERWVYRHPEDGRMQAVWFAHAKVLRIE